MPLKGGGAILNPMSNDEEMQNEIARLHRRLTAVTQHLDIISAKLAAIGLNVDRITRAIDDYEDAPEADGEVIPFPPRDEPA